MKTRSIVLVGSALATALIVWLLQGLMRNPVPTQPTAQPSMPATQPAIIGAQPASNGVTPGGAATAQDNTVPSREEIAETKRLHEHVLDRSALDKAILTGDPYKWMPVLAEALHFNVTRENGIAWLRGYLSHADNDVRANSAAFLFELGSRDGGPVLVRLFEDIAAGVTVSTSAERMADALYRYRYPIDPDLVFIAYEKQRTPALLMYAQILGSRLAIEPTKRALLKSVPYGRGVLMAGMMRLKDEESIGAYLKIQQADMRPEAQADVNWALYRATEDDKYLNHLIAVAEESVGLRPPTGISNAHATEVAMMALQQSVSPRTTEALRRIDARAREQNLNIAESAALIGLYYFHRDYDYIDRLLLEQFGDKRPGDGMSRQWELAAARRTPDIEAAARSSNPEAYAREFILKEGRPVETWVFGSISLYIPTDVRPPLKE